MTSLLEKFISVIAPHTCFLCSKENNVLCDECFAEVFDENHEACFACNLPTVDGELCVSCDLKSQLSRVWLAGTYDGPRRELIKLYKFERRRAAYMPLADALDRALPYLEGMVVVPIPTATRRVRVRGYDHVALVAKELAGRRGWRYEPALYRKHNLRQVGASRELRARQAATAYGLGGVAKLADKRVLLIDDVVTSGATLQAAASVISLAKPKEIMAAAITKQILS